MENNLIWLVKLLLAHLLSDFLLQKTAWVTDRNRKKIKSAYLYLHVLITGLTALIFIGPQYWQIVLFISVTHYIIDLAKSYAKRNFGNFLLDQVAHIGLIFSCWAYQFDRIPSLQEIHDFYNNDSFWIWAAGLFFLMFPSSIIIGKATEHWSKQIISPAVTASSTTASTSTESLLNAGKYIGMIERLIICFLVYNGQYDAIGLLMAGKSILRYGTAKEEVKTEYLLVGTLISMSIAFAIGLLLKWAEGLNVI